MAGFFDDELSAAEIEEEYIERLVPTEGAELWDRSVEESPVWNDMTPEQHIIAADLFSEAVASGSLEVAEDFTDFLNIEWDIQDIRDFWEAYDQLAG